MVVGGRGPSGRVLGDEEEFKEVKRQRGRTGCVQNRRKAILIYKALV